MKHIKIFENFPESGVPDEYQRKTGDMTGDYRHMHVDGGRDSSPAVKLNTGDKDKLFSIKFDFWNHSRHTIFKDSDLEFNKYVTICMPMIDSESRKSGVSVDDIIAIAKKFWDESRLIGDYTDFRDDRKRFDAFNT